MLSVPTVQPVRQRAGLVTWLRFAVSAALIGWIAYRLDWMEVVETVRGANAFYLALSLLLTPVLMMTGVLKWQILLRSQEIPARTSTCFNFYLIGTFFNNFLPTNFGGDVVRAFLMSRATGRPATAAASVFMERFLGLAVLIAMVPLALLLSPVGLWTGSIRTVIAAVALVCLGILWGLVDRRLHGALARGAQIGIVRKLIRFQEEITAYGRQRRALLAGLALSLAFYALAVCNVLVSLLAFNIELDVISVFVVTVVVLVVSMLPIAINGIGLAEWTYIFALSQFGVPAAAALSAALLIRLKTLAWSLLGGGMYGLGYSAKVTVEQIKSPVGAGQVKND